jgi:hypothetical protein
MRLKDKNMENNSTSENPKEVSNFENYTGEQRMSILVEALSSTKSISTILAEKNIPEEVFYSWKMKYLNLFI